MSKEIKIDEIISASTNRSSEKSKKVKSVEKSTKERPAKPTNATGMPGDFSQIFNDPEMVKMFAGGKIPGFGKLPLKQRIMFKLMGFFGRFQGKGLMRKRWWPLWGILLIGLLAILLVVGIFFLIFKVIKMILSPYIDMFRRKG